MIFQVDKLCIQIIGAKYSKLLNLRHGELFSRHWRMHVRGVLTDLNMKPAFPLWLLLPAVVRRSS